MTARYKQIPIGNSDFGEIIRENQYYVDKSLFIKEILDSGAKITLITRPRRFGKTCNLSLLKYFFESEIPQSSVPSIVRAKSPHKNQNLFAELAIARQGKEYMQHQGVYPVVSFSLKDTKARSWQECMAKIQSILAEVYEEHSYLIERNSLSKIEAKDFSSIINRQASPMVLEESLQKLVKYLYRYYQKEVIVLIDEYDTPVHEAYENGFYRDVIDFLRAFLGKSLKDNIQVTRAVITGILRVTKENIFSDLNNPDVVTLLSGKYADKFGFTEQEVKHFLQYYQIEESLTNVQKWYDGYAIGKERGLYNPWSIINYIDKHSEGFQPYWINTSRNTLINHLLARSSQTVKNELESLINRESIEKQLNHYITFGEIEKNSDALWSFLFFTGYLKVVEKILPEEEGDAIKYVLSIPNLEVRSIYHKFISEWFTDYLAESEINLFFRALLSGEDKTVRQALQKYVRGSMSFFDPTGEEPEKVYHAFVLGMLIHLKTHSVRSNRESGFGRYDVMLIPLDRSNPGVILEFKKVETEDNETLEKACHAALEQIEEKKYETELEQLGIKTIYKYGVAFEGKKVLVKKGRT